MLRWAHCVSLLQKTKAVVGAWLGQRHCQKERAKCKQACKIINYFLNWKEENRQKKISRISGFCFSWSKNGCFLTHTFLKRNLLKPLLVFLGCALLGPSCQKRKFYDLCEVIIWAKFGLLNGYFLGQVRVTIWASHYKNGGCEASFAQLSFCFFVVNYLEFVFCCWKRRK